MNGSHIPYFLKWNHRDIFSMRRMSRMLKCNACEKEVESKEYNNEAAECNECHHENFPNDGCQCFQCFERHVCRAEAMNED